jgi:LmbE family N-acetylglucosaminyl deacetylase
MKYNCLFIGAHPDDLEIGTGGTIAKLRQAGHSVRLLIMTDDADPGAAKQRRVEAVAAASALGLTASDVSFLGLPDGRLRCDPESVGKVRDVVAQFNPDLVFTHSSADDHQDHRATHEISQGAVRKCPRLYYAVVNHLVTSSFSPKVFVDVQAQWPSKLAALDAHTTQANRINRENIERHCRGFVRTCGIGLAEAFEFDLPIAAEAGSTVLSSINDSPFHKLWSSLIATGPLYLIFSIPVSRAVREFSWPSHADMDGIALFRKTVDLQWPEGRSIIEECRCDTPVAEEAIKCGNVLLSGGPISNPMTRTYFNYFEGVRYVNDHTMPDFRNVSILDRKTGNRIKAAYVADANGTKTIERDIGNLTIMKNPCNPAHTLVAVMGIHGPGTVGCYKVLTQPTLISQLLQICEMPFRGRGFQILLNYDVYKGEPSLIPESLHVID